MFERGLTHKELASELGISSVQVENLRTGVSKMPGERICNKIINYCEQHDIDIDINWNDVLFDIFTNSEYFRGYTWVRDLDDDGYVLLKHKECGRKTLVPRQAFGNKSTPCIHCWVEKYVSSDAYDVDTSDDSYRHKFTHKCGHAYSVAYDEIKQKKFRCPVCYGHRYSTDNPHNNSNTSRYVTRAPQRVERTIPLWDEHLKNRIQETAERYGFSTEERDSVHCSFTYPDMTNGQFAVVCNTCFESELLDKAESSVQKIIEFANKHKAECEKPDDCIIEYTKRQRVVWIPDVERILHTISLVPQGEATVPRFLEKLRVSEYSHEVYVAGHEAPEDGKTMYAYFHYYNDDSPTDYMDLLVATAPEQFGGMTFYAYPKAYMDLLYQEIQISLNKHTDNAEALQHTCDEYIDTVNYFRANDIQIFIQAEMSRSIHELISLIKSAPIPQRQADTKKLLSLQRCPVCRGLHTSYAHVCGNCGFDELNKMFINKDECEIWFNEVVLPARKSYERHE